MSSTQIYGVRETIAELNALDKKLKWQAVREIKAAAEPMRAAIASQIPTTAPISGWAHRGRLGWNSKGATKVVTKYGGRKARGANEWPLVRVMLQGAAASMYDMAGRASSGSTAQGQAFIEALPGNASRAAWPTAERFLPATQRAVALAIQKVGQQVNKNLKPRGGI